VEKTKATVVQTDQNHSDDLCYVFTQYRVSSVVGQT